MPVVLGAAGVERIIELQLSDERAGRLPEERRRRQGAGGDDGAVGRVRFFCLKTEIIQSLTDTFEGHAQQTDGGVEYWLGRDLQHLLGYTEWRNFTAVISKAKTACEVSGHPGADHFVDVNKRIEMPKSAERGP